MDKELVVCPICGDMDFDIYMQDNQCIECWERGEDDNRERLYD